MALFKSDKERLKEAKNKILKTNEFDGKVGQVHQGLNELGLWGVSDNGKTVFKPSKFKIYDDKIMIVRSRTFINLSDIKEMFQENEMESIIILKNDNAIPIRAKNYHSWDIINFKAFLTILNELIEENNSSNSNSGFDGNSGENKTAENSEDKFDKLIKLGEMYDKGLLSDEEFSSLKQELLSGNNEEATSVSKNDDDELLDVACENCGAEVSEEDVFCSECGTRLD